MTAKAALAISLLKGDVLNVKNCLTIVGLSNCSREISRMIEQPFGVQVSRTRRDSYSRYGQPIFWYDFRLNKTEYNAPGITKMKEYISSQLSSEPPPKTDKEVKEVKKIKSLTATNGQQSFL